MYIMFRYSTWESDRELKDSSTVGVSTLIIKWESDRELKESNGDFCSLESLLYCENPIGNWKYTYNQPFQRHPSLSENPIGNWKNFPRRIGVLNNLMWESDRELKDDIAELDQFELPAPRENPIGNWKKFSLILFSTVKPSVRIR